MGLEASVAGAAAANTTGKIKKCKDASGRWHYGDSADAECGHSKIIELSDQGIETGEVAAPLTEEQLKQRERNKSALDAEKKRAEEQARKDQLLLSTYGHEDDITFVRDRKIADVDGQIGSSQQTLTSLRANLKRVEAQGAEEQKGGKPMPESTAKNLANVRSQIAKHEDFINLKQQEKEAIRLQAQQDIERYRVLKKGQMTTTSGTPAAK
jgi:hypothetical protein